MRDRSESYKRWYSDLPSLRESAEEGAIVLVGRKLGQVGTACREGELNKDAADALAHRGREPYARCEDAHPEQREADDALRA